MSYSAGLAIWKLAFQLSPILLVDGLATQITGSVLPIIVFTQAANFLTGLLSGTENIEFDDFFAHFKPLPGGTLFDLQIGTYPFANQNVAANATIQQPLQLSMEMACPARDLLGYPLKLGVMTVLQQVFTKHATMGGTYTVCTPAVILTNGILNAMRDISDGEDKQVQSRYQLDFTFPLLTLEQAQSAQNSLMNTLTNQTQINGTPAWSGLGNTVGNAPSLGSVGTIPADSSVPAIAPFPGF